MIPLRLYGYIGIAIAVLAAGAYVWHLKAKADRVDAAEERAETLERSLATLQAAHAHERKIAKDASDAYQAELARIRSAPSIGPVRLCRSPTGYVPAPAATLARPDGSAPGRVEVEAGEDIGPALDRYGSDCEAVAAQLRGLQGWVKAR